MCIQYIQNFSYFLNVIPKFGILLRFVNYFYVSWVRTVQENIDFVYQRLKSLNMTDHKNKNIKD